MSKKLQPIIEYTFTLEGLPSGRQEREPNTKTLSSFIKLMSVNESRKKICNEGKSQTISAGTWSNIFMGRRNPSAKLGTENQVDVRGKLLCWTIIL